MKKLLLLSLPFFLFMTRWGVAQEYVPPGWSEEAVGIEGVGVRFSSPAVAEIDGILENGKEIVVAGIDGILSVFSATGELVWSTHLPNYGCGSEQRRTFSSPAVGELFGDGVPYVVIGYGGMTVEDAKCGGGMVAFRGSNGEQQWHFNLKKYNKRRARLEHVSRERLLGVFTTPALADVDGNGDLEVGFGAYDRHVYLLNSRGKVIWNYQAADTVWASPAFANVDRDSALEMIVGTDISGNSVIQPPTKNGGYLYAFKTKLRKKLVLRYGKRKNVLIRFRDKNAYRWQTWFDQVIFASPVVADVLPESAGPEVITATGYFFPQETKQKNGKWIKILSAKSGKVLRTIDMPAPSASSVAIADVDGDGALEIIALTNADRDYGGDGPTYLSVIVPTTGELLWQTTLSSTEGNMYFNSPIAADLDGNGSLEIVVNHARKVLIFDGITGGNLICSENCDNDYPSFSLSGSVNNSPAIADLDGDGRLDLVAAGGRGLSVWTGFDQLIDSTPGANAPYAAPWSHARRNAMRTGS